MKLKVGKEYRVFGNRNIIVKIVKKSSNPVWCFHDEQGCSYKEDGTSYHGSMTDLVENCTCGNPIFNFPCVCEFIKKNPGKNDYCCEFCGIYTASKPRCNKCEQS